MNELELSALDGANPLGFLAALGTLVVLSETDPQLKLGWHAGARWTPFLTSPNPLDETKILQRLTKRLRGQPVSETAERKREASQKRFDAAKKRLKNANDELNVTGRFKRDHVGSKLVPFEDFKIPHLGFLI